MQSRENKWDVQIASAEGEVRRLKMRKFRNEFWHFYAEQYPDDINLRPDHIDSNVYHQIAGLVVSQYLAQDRVGIYLRAPDGDESEESAQLVEQYAAALAGGFDYKYMDSNDRDNWLNMAKWLHQKLLDFRSVLDASGFNGD